MATSQEDSEHQQEETRDIRISIVGNSHIKRYPLELFPKGYKAVTASFFTHITHFHKTGQYYYISQYKEKADASMVMDAGNDVAFWGERPPTDEQIIYATVKTAEHLHHHGIIPIIVPILNRTFTNYSITGVSARQYQARAKYINGIVKREIRRKLGYDAVLDINPEKIELTEDGVHLSKRAYEQITEEAIVQIHQIRAEQDRKRNRKRKMKEEEKYQLEKYKIEDEEDRRQRARVRTDTSNKNMKAPQPSTSTKATTGTTEPKPSCSNEQTPPSNTKETQTERITLVSRADNIFLTEETTGSQTAEKPPGINAETQTESLDSLIREEASRMLRQMLQQLNPPQA